MADEPTSDPVLDKRGNVIPAHLLPDWEDRLLCEKALRQMDRLLAPIRKMIDEGRNSTVWMLPADHEEHRRARQQLWSTLPYALCDECDGAEGGCEKCRHSGWLLKMHWDKDFATVKQVALLKKYRIDVTTQPKSLASRIIDEIASNQWEVPDSLKHLQSEKDLPEDIPLEF